MKALPLLLLLLLVCACGGTSTATTSSSASSSSSTSSASTTGAVTATQTPSTTGGTPQASGGGFVACPTGGPSSGEPPASDNGAKGSCEAAEILFPASGLPCRPPSGQTYSSSSHCPLMPQLAARLDANPLSASGGGADPVCRCQSNWQSATWQVEGPTAAGPTTYDVRVVLDFGPSSQESFDVIVDGVESGSLIADIQCAGMGSSSSIFAASPPACG